jgi:hypothetical protein
MKIAIAICGALYLIPTSANADVICGRRGCHDRPNCTLVRKGTGPNPIQFTQTICHSKNGGVTTTRSKDH